MNLFDDILTKNTFKNLGLVGITEDLFSELLVEAFNKNNQNILVVTSTLFEANKILSNLSNYTSDCLLFPMDDFLTSEAVAISPDLRINRLDTLNSLLNNKKIVITNLMGYLRYLPDVKVYRNSFITLNVGDTIDQKELISKLINLGYVRESLVTRTGEIGIRGFVFDIFSLGSEHPYRIEFFGDEIESIRIFDEDNQKSLTDVDSITILPYHEFILDNPSEVPTNHSQKYLKQYSKNVSSLIDYMDNAIVIYKDIMQIKASYETMIEEITEYQSTKDLDFKDRYMFDFQILNDACFYYTLDNLVNNKDINVINFESSLVPQFNENIEAINSYLKENISLGKTIVICLKDYQTHNFIKYLTVPYVLTNDNKLFVNQVNIVNKNIEEGFSYGKYIFIASKNLFNVHEERKNFKTSYKFASKIKDINKLNIGDYVVHDINGIGIYDGIKTLKVGQVYKDFIVVLYEGNDKLYIPVEKIDLISKYSGRDGAVVKVHKLGGNEWKKTKLRVKKKLQDVANQLIELYAKREMQKGFMFSEDSDMQLSFEDEFAYTPTMDQIKVTKEIKEDMQSSKPMDRLLCGDVGYGKTEVAFRAMFKAVMDSKQVLYLCPTTILSNQQYNNALERFKNYPIRIGLLNRFTSQKDKTRIISELQDGKIDIVFGTHRLLSDDIKPRDLGLLVIDEEQRFGVMHKEKIKKYKANVDVLTLTATPIPRTLQMSMVGIRSLSLIETPPEARYPIQTYVIEENKQIIRDAIYKELSRGGQVYILYNRVESIDEKKDQIQSLIPEARILIAHGKMSKDDLEDRMLRVIRHEADILLCTTIIETGIDIPNVNTLIILDADCFGLSQLYQIRGRVGRSNKIAYAYLMYQPSKMLGDNAMKRLNAIKEFTELGSGFAIASRDLSIRGAGDVLGSEQAGFIDSVGIDLYLKMLEEEVSRLKGNSNNKYEEVINEKPIINVTTHISDEYVDDTDLKIEIHRKINEIDSYEKLIEVRDELTDRFGTLSDDLILYMYEEWFEKIAKRLQITSVKEFKTNIEIIFSPEITAKIDGEELFQKSFKISNNFRFKVLNDCLVIVLDIINLEKHYLYYIVELLKDIEIK